MRIGVILDNEITRDERVLNELKSLVVAHHDVYLLCLTTANQPQSEFLNGFHVQRITIPKKRRDILFGINNTIPLYDTIWTKAIKRFIKANNIQALHVHDLYMSRSAHRAIKNTNIKMTLDLHENYPQAVKSYTWANKFPKSILAQPHKWQKKEEPYLLHADTIVVLSNSFKDQLINKYHSLADKRFVLYPNVPDTDKLLSYPIDQNIVANHNSFTLFYFGVIGIRRGIFTCFEALRILIPQIPDIKLLIIGPVDRADKPLFDQYLFDNQLSPHIIYHPWKDITQLPSYITASDICLSPLFKNPQHESGLANKIFQYMLFSRPLLVSDCKPQADLVSETQCGLVFKSQDPADLAQKVIQLYNSPQQRQQMGLNGKQAVTKLYNLNTMGKNIASIYNN